MYFKLHVLVFQSLQHCIILTISSCSKRAVSVLGIISRAHSILWTAEFRAKPRNLGFTVVNFGIYQIHLRICQILPWKIVGPNDQKQPFLLFPVLNEY